MARSHDDENLEKAKKKADLNSSVRRSNLLNFAATTALTFGVPMYMGVSVKPILPLYALLVIQDMGIIIGPSISMLGLSLNPSGFYQLYKTADHSIFTDGYKHILKFSETFFGKAANLDVAFNDFSNFSRDSFKQAAGFTLFCSILLVSAQCTATIISNSMRRSYSESADADIPMRRPTLHIQ